MWWIILPWTYLESPGPNPKMLCLQATLDSWHASQNGIWILQGCWHRLSTTRWASHRCSWTSAICMTWWQFAQAWSGRKGVALWNREHKDTNPSSFNFAFWSSVSLSHLTRVFETHLPNPGLTLYSCSSSNLFYFVDQIVILKGISSNTFWCFSPVAACLKICTLLNYTGTTRYCIASMRQREIALTAHLDQLQMYPMPFALDE